MIQRVLNTLTRIIANTFFRRIDVVGEENIPKEGPLIFAGNHPNALMDGFLLNATCGRLPLRFMVNAKLWDFKLLAPFLNATGAVAVYRREECTEEHDNQGAFDRLYEVLESGECMGIFPEGISHVESQLVRLKTGTARIALEVSARGRTGVKIIPCGLNYIHRHRFRSQVLIEFGQPIVIDEQWVREYREDEHATVLKLTEKLAEALVNVTLNAPDWRTLRLIQTIRRLYKPASAELSPGQYIELSRRFVNGYLLQKDDPDMVNFADVAENYQAKLDLLGLKDYQLRHTISPWRTFRTVLLRSTRMLLLLPLAIPGALLHLPVGWVAATVGNRFSYEKDDVATLKVFATILLLPILYIATAIVVGQYFGFWWAMAVMLILPLSFLSSVRLIEAEVSLYISMLSMLRLARLGSDLDRLRSQRAELVVEVRALVNKYTEPDLPRFFTDKDFN